MAISLIFFLDASLTDKRQGLGQVPRGKGSSIESGGEHLKRRRRREVHGGLEHWFARVSLRPTSPTSSS
ncbi:hypothetical protein SAY86_013781 [Trapa natans]|uniref:Uncharacterized protein n=1 Tax=Trapa natans TaxID=22666 RepID=A0AAN7QMY4_TRANT|nr:hypothetical protein SAY86_013781 [Trapa natans]